MNDLLQSLLPSGRRLITPELASGDLAQYPEEECAPFLIPLARAIPLGALDAVVKDALKSFQPGDNAADAELAPAIHRALPLTRREASDPGVFRHLAVVRHPQLVRHRWEYRSFATMQTRFWRHGTRHDANAFSRWWWIAELTCDAGDYTLTQKVLERSALATHLFSRDIASHLPTVRVMATLLGNEPTPRVEAALKNFGKMLSVRVLEVLEEREIEALLRRALALTMGHRQSPTR